MAYRGTLQEHREPSFGERLSSGLANAAGQAAVGIPKMMGQQMQTKQENEAIKRLTGQDVSGLSPDIKKLFIEKILPGMQKRTNSLESIGKVESLMGNKRKPQDQMSPEDKENVFRQIMQEMPSDEGEFNEREQQAKTGDLSQKLWDQLNAPQTQREEDVDPLTEASEKAKMYEALGEGELAKHSFEEGKILSKKKSDQESENFKINEPIYSAAVKQASSGKRDAARYDRLLALEDTGNVAENVTFSLDKDGNIRPAATLFGGGLTPEGHEYVKIVNDFLKDVKDTLGSKVVSNYDIQAYMRTLPTLMQSAEGRRAVLRDLKLMNVLNQGEAAVKKSVADEFGLRLSPEKFQKFVDERLADYEQAILDEYVNPTVGYKPLSKEKMAEFIQESSGGSPQEKIENAKKMAAKQGYMTE